MRYAVYDSNRMTVAVIQRRTLAVGQAQVQPMRHNPAHET